jgi:hypothetical protein
MSSLTLFDTQSILLVGIATAYGLDGQISIPDIARFLFFKSVQTYSEPTQPFIRWVEVAISPRGVKLRKHLYLVQRSRKMELYLYSPTRFHGIVLN